MDDDLLPNNSIVKNYVVEGFISKGQFGAVYTVIEINSKEKFALKVVKNVFYKIKAFSPF